MSKKILSLVATAVVCGLFLTLIPHEAKAFTCETFTVTPPTGDPNTVFDIEAKGCNNEGESALTIDLDILVVAPEGYESFFEPTVPQDATNYTIRGQIAGFVINNTSGVYTVKLVQRRGMTIPIEIKQATITITAPEPPPGDDDPPPGPSCGQVCSQNSTCSLCPETCPANRSTRTFPDGSRQVVWTCEIQEISFTGACGDNGINTAVGCIPTGNLNNFAAFFLRWGLGFSGGLAIVMLIYSSFLIMISAGDPSRLQSGKDLLLSTVSGILLLVFCVFVLRIIGVNVLGLF